MVSHIKKEVYIIENVSYVKFVSKYPVKGHFQMDDMI
jgi:hypothetical protein